MAERKIYFIVDGDGLYYSLRKNRFIRDYGAAQWSGCRSAAKSVIKNKGLKGCRIITKWIDNGW